MCVLATQSCPTLCKPMDYNLSGSSVHGILQARILELLPFPPPGSLPNPGIKPRKGGVASLFFFLAYLKFYQLYFSLKKKKTAPCLFSTAFITGTE